MLKKVTNPCKSLYKINYLKTKIQYKQMNEIEQTWKQFQGRQNVRKQNNFMRSQSPSKQIQPDFQQIKQTRREGSKYQQLLARLEQESFYDDSLFFDKKNAFNMGNPQQKKFKTIYHKIILSNKSDPLHPSSYKRFESSQQAKYHRAKLNIDNQKFSDSRLRIQLDNTDRSRIDVLESIRQKLSNKGEQNNMKDRKKFFNHLFKKFTQSADEDASIHYKQKVQLFKKIFQHYKIKPEQREHFQEILKKMTEKDAEAWAMSNKISTKMNLELRRNNNSVSERRADSSNNPRPKMKQKSTKTSHQRRTPKQGNLSHMLSVDAKASRQQDIFIAINSKTATREQKHITQLEQELSSRKEQYKTAQEETNRMTSFTHTQHRTRVLEKKLNIPNMNQSIRHQTPIDIKLQKFREFLFAINFGNHLFVPLEVEKYQTPFKIFIGKGNNSNLIKAIFKKRFWFEVTKNINEAHLIWTQLKQEDVFQRQQPKRYAPERQRQSKIQQQKDKQNPLKQKLQTETPEQNPECDQEPVFDQQQLQYSIQNQKQSPVIENVRILDFKSLKLKKRPNLSKFISVESQRIYPSQKKAEKGEKGSNQVRFQQNSLKTKKYPQLLALKNTQILAKQPLTKVLCAAQMDEFNEFYRKYLKNPLKIPGFKIPSFEERRKDVLISANGQALREQEKHQIVIQNHLPFNGILGNKKAMFYILREYCNLTGRNLFSTVPLTYHIKHGLKDEEYKKFAQQFESRRKSNKINYWVMKPGEFSNRGNGIECTNKLQYVRKRIQACAGKVDPKRPKAPLSTKSIILQSYITDLLLYNGRKFDIRTYMMVTIVNGKIKAYWYEEGYIRTSSHMWNLAEIEDREIHLTNDAVQKYSDNYGKYEAGNKLSYRDIQRYLETYEKAGKNVVYEKILPQMKEIAALSLKASYLFLDPSKLQNNFEIFGFDFMLDSKLKPWLIQINTNPCLELGCPILERIIPNMLENAFRIAVDPLFPPPSSFSSNYKYNIAENAVHYNKFELIFDEDRDGPQILKLYQNKSLEDILTKIEDIQEDKEVFEEDGEELDLSQNI